MFSALGTRLTLPCIWRPPRLFCSSYQMTRRPLLGTGTRCVTRGAWKGISGIPGFGQNTVQNSGNDYCYPGSGIRQNSDAEVSRDSREKRRGMRDRDLFPDPMLRHCGTFIDQFRNITFLAIPWIIELKILCAPSSPQICGLRFVFLINQDIPGATKETKQVTPSQHGKVT